MAVRNLAAGAPLGADSARPGGLDAGAARGMYKGTGSRESRRSIGSRPSKASVSGASTSTSRLRAQENREHLMGVLDRRRRLSHANRLARGSGEGVYVEAASRGVSPTLPHAMDSYQSAESAGGGNAAAAHPSSLPRHGSVDSSALDETSGTGGAAAVMER